MPNGTKLALGAIQFRPVCRFGLRMPATSATVMNSSGTGISIESNPEPPAFLRWRPVAFRPWPSRTSNR